MPEPRPRILVVDDREQNRYVLCRVLERAGYSVEQASTGREALERVQSLPDLAVLDVSLPDMSGLEVCQAIKRNPRTAQVAVLQISAAFVSNGDKAQALNAGADGYLTHPIDGVVLLATVRSMLRLQKAEALAREAASQWQSTFDALQEGLAVVDRDGKLVRRNSAFARMCGHGCPCEVGDAALDVLQRTFGTTEPLDNSGAQRYSAEYLVANRTIQLTVDSLQGDTGPEGKVIVLSDITDRKLADYAIRTAEKLAETGRLAQSLAHEINNPLEAVTNLIYLAQTAAVHRDVKQYLRYAGDELDRIGRITKQSLSFHRDTGRPVSVDLGEIIREVVELYASFVKARDVKIVWEEKPTLSITGFPGQLRQVFSNLIRNAAEASPPQSEVTVRIRMALRSGGQGARIMIHDRGAGISKNVRERMFDPFFTTKEMKGSGLGLWVSRNIIAQHHGTLRVRSRTIPGSSGTTFEVFLPIGALERAVASDARNRRRA